MSTDLAVCFQFCKLLLSVSAITITKTELLRLLSSDFLTILLGGLLAGNRKQKETLGLKGVVSYESF